jgi:hypothetical protein
MMMMMRVVLRNVKKILVRRSEKKNPFGKPRQRRLIIVKWIIRKQGKKVWIGFEWLRVGINGGFLRTQ